MTGIGKQLSREEFDKLYSENKLVNPRQRQKHWSEPYYPYNVAEAELEDGSSVWCKAYDKGDSRNRAVE